MIVKVVIAKSSGIFATIWNPSTGIRDQKGPPWTAFVDEPTILNSGLAVSPAPVNGLMIAPLEGDPTAAHLSLGVGPIDVQFAVLLPVLMGALEALKQKTEPDPDSSRLN